MKAITILAAVCLAGTTAAWASQQTKLSDLPAPVQVTVKAETTNATLVGISKETEKGKTIFEVETKVGGKTRDLLVDATGTVIEVEEEIDPAAVPSAVKATIDKQSAGGTVQRLERLTRGAAVSYEVVLKKAGKTTEITVNPDGTIRK